MPIGVQAEIRTLPVAQLASYASVPIAFRVTGRMVRERDVSGLDTLVEVPVAAPFDKDYDAVPGVPPLDWATRYALARWGLLVAEVEGGVVGGAAVAPVAEVMPEHDLAPGSGVLWDLRVAPEWRGRGIGSVLFRASEHWAEARGFRMLVVETQDINVAACRLYTRMGCRLLSYEEHAYDTMPDEARLLWGAPLEGR